MSTIRLMSKARNALLGLSLTGALTMAGVQAANPVASAQSPDPATTTSDCIVPDDLALRAGVPVPPDHYPHETWLATGHGPAAARALSAELATRFGTNIKR